VSPVVPPLYEPQLAVAGAPADSLVGWAAEPKLDGWRVQVAVSPELDDGIRITTRSGRPIRAAVAGLEGLVNAGFEVVIDAELVAGDGSARSFYDVAPSLARRGRTEPVGLAVFDLLWCEGHELVDLPDRHRRRVLEELALPGIALVPRFDPADAATLLVCCERLGVEGLVLKQLAAPYRPGRRSPAWRKLKCSSWRSKHAPRRRPR
jgi:bifunctional non-homologous end joining protein LigD